MDIFLNIQIFSPDSLHRNIMNIWFWPDLYYTEQKQLLATQFMIFQNVLHTNEVITYRN